ncbi:hypothetical protein [uncultured Tessaracoccus sp.]|uniref:hypothetical protein n=1 Tax=uncultured Tessaracoccus sp. TaxID=905023 RepID=UPI0025F57487|nr:hypothetical protein [uncultured Tessaracoccus sp.]
MDAPAGLGVGGAFDWYREQGERRLLGVSPGTLIADAETASLLAVFTHKEIWAWAHDQSQAVLGWQPLPFLDGSRAHLLWTDLTDLGGIVGAVVRIGTPRTHDDAGAPLEAPTATAAALARTIRLGEERRTRPA